MVEKPFLMLNTKGQFFFLGVEQVRLTIRQTQDIEFHPMKEVILKYVIFFYTPNFFFEFFLIYGTGGSTNQTEKFSSPLKSIRMYLCTHSGKEKAIILYRLKVHFRTIYMV